VGEQKRLIRMPSPRQFVLDTSVALKWFVEADEKYVSVARELRDAFCEGRCVLSAPNLLLIELANALTAGHRARAEKVNEAIGTVQKLAIQFVELEVGTLARAVELAASYAVTVYDTYFWALAMDSGSTLVTADERFLRKVGPHPDIVSLRHLRIPGESA
jgi:predicted nucleic acid-binding protein